MVHLCSISVHLVLFLFALVYICSGQVIIRGNEEPLTVGLSRDLKCMWSGGSNVSTMEWFVVGLEATAIETATETTSVVLTLTPDDDGLDGTMLLCRVTLSTGQEAEETITLSVQAIQNEVSISSAMSNATAGHPYTLVCTVFSARASNLRWVNPDGGFIEDGSNFSGWSDEISPTELSLIYSGWSNGTSTLELTFHSIRTSQSGVYKCVSNIAFPSSVSEESFMVQIQIPAPLVTILRDPTPPTQLFSSHSLVLTCMIQLIPEVDSYITIDSRWSGHSTLTDRERRVIVSDLRGVQLMYNTSVTITEMKSSDSGSYVCSASVSPLPGTNNLLRSPHVEEIITISVALKVTIDVTYNPPSDFNLPTPPYYRPATSVTLTCRAHHPVGPVSYEWSSTCNSCFSSSSSSQSITDNILQSNDAGIHTCTATDSSSNNGTNSTEMKLIGIGIYVQHSQYINGMAVKNNSLIVQKHNYCYYCKVDVYCHSNSTLESVGYFLFPDEATVYSDGNYAHYSVYQTEYAGVQMRSYYSYTPDMWGIFICTIPDSESNTLEASIGIYSSMPSAPSVYSVKYTDWSETESDLLGTIECLTQNSPPTSVTWLRDGIPVEVDGVGLEMIQTVVERWSYSRYNNTLLVRNAAQLAGNHTYNCTVTNAAGTNTNWVNTTLTAQPIVEMSMEDEAINLQSFNITCRASLHQKVASHLIHYLVLDWVGADGQSLSETEGVTVGPQYIFTNTSTKSLVFDPLTWQHCGDYRCEAKLLLPRPAGSFNTSLHYHLNTLNRTLIQLKFGAVVHCSKWYEDRDIAIYLEYNIKQTLADVINKNCSCGFKASQIDHGEFSCRNIADGHVIYRARLTGSCDTMTIPELLEVISDWVANDGTFLYTYHGNMRLGLDQYCPLDIASFSQPECGNKPFQD